MLRETLTLGGLGISDNGESEGVSKSGCCSLRTGLPESFASLYPVDKEVREKISIGYEHTVFATVCANSSKLSLPSPS